MDTGRLITAMVTPMRADLSVDYERAKQLAQRLVEHGSEGLLVAGTTGESPTMTLDEKLGLFEAVVDAVGDQVMVWAGTGNNNTAATRELTEKAETLGVSGIMLVTPYYNKPSQEGMRRHFSEVATATKLPIMVYNIPGRTGVNLLPETVASLAEEIPHLVAIKEAGGNVDQVADLVRILPKGFTVLSGDDKFTLPFLAVGAKGVVSVASHVVGGEIAEMIQSFESGQPRAAKNVHLRLLPLFRGLFLAPNPVPVKTALRLTGFDCGGVRLPLVALSDVEEAMLREVLRGVGVI